jgi:deazaflavin-dependent oxidoreductase (nitroreductase family)
MLLFQIGSKLMKGSTMSAIGNTHNLSPSHADAAAAAPRFGGIFWRLSRRTKGLGLPLAGSRWNAAFAVVEHVGRRSGRLHRTPVAARRVSNGFVISLAFGAQVHWNRNLAAAGGGTIRWRGVEYPVTAPEVIDAQAGLAAFHAVQRLALQIAGIDGYVLLRDVVSSRR